jgi:hypothetical protein
MQLSGIWTLLWQPIQNCMAGKPGFAALAGSAWQLSHFIVWT